MVAGIKPNAMLFFIHFLFLLQKIEQRRHLSFERPGNNAMCVCAVAVMNLNEYLLIFFGLFNLKHLLCSRENYCLYNGCHLSVKFAEWKLVFGLVFVPIIMAICFDRCSSIFKLFETIQIHLEAIQFELDRIGLDWTVSLAVGRLVCLKFHLKIRSRIPSK